MQSKFCLPFLSLVSLTVQTQNAIAQTYQPSNRPPVADNTLGTNVSLNGNNFNITGGLSRGQTLFHSFNDFSVPTGGSANFSINPTVTRDIISRVTGSSFSDINGLINSNGANFFLINPNGITFGPNASLNVGKAFMASTADGINLSDGKGGSFTFGKSGVGDVPLLSVNSNVLFNPSQLVMSGGNGQINNFGTLQTNNPSQYIGLIGGNVNINGGQINAPGGRVELGGLSEFGTVILGSDVNNIQVQFPINVAKGDVSLTNGARVDVAGSGGGDVAINARNVQISGGSGIFGGIIGLGTPTTVAGDVKINATNDVVISNPNSGIFNNVYPNASGRQGGDVTIEAGSVKLQDSAQIQTVTYATGDAGKVVINAPGDVVLTNRAGIFTNISLTGDGNSKGLNITAKNIVLSDLSTIESSNNGGKGNAGDVTLNATNGNVSIVGIFDESVLPTNDTDIKSKISSTTSGEGNAGKVTINAQGSVLLANRAGIFTSNEGGQGNAGDVTITATDKVYISGTLDQSQLQGNKIQALSRISSVTNSKGNTGKVTINAQGDVLLGDRAGIFTSISQTGEGNSNGVTIAAKNVTLGILSTIQSDNYGGKGSAGDVDIKTVGNVDITGTFNPALLTGSDIRALSGISSSTNGKGNTGKVTIDAGGNVRISNRGGIFSNISSAGDGNSKGVNITAKSILLSDLSSIESSNNGGKGNAGDITLNTTNGLVGIVGILDESVLPTNDTDIKSKISSTTSGEGNAGNVTIKAQGFVLLNRAGILTSNEGGRGNAGDVTITATSDIINMTGTSDQSLLKGDNLLSLSQISSVTNGTGNAGKVTINTPSNLFLANRAGIFTNTTQTGKGDSQGVSIAAKDITLTNLSTIQANNDGGKGIAGNIDITATGDINITGTSNQSLLKGDNISSLSTISSITQGTGNAGKVTINTPGNLLLANRAGIFTNITQTGKGDSHGVSIAAKDVTVTDLSAIQANNAGGTGSAGNIDITATGNVRIRGTSDQSLLKGDNISLLSAISSTTNGKGNTGKVTIDAGADVSISKRGVIFTSIGSTGDGNSKGVNITAKNILLADLSSIESSNNGGKGNAGDVTLYAKNGDVGIINILDESMLPINDTDIKSKISSTTSGEGNAGNVNIKAQGFLLFNRAGIFTSNEGAQGNAGDVTITATGNINITGTFAQSQLQGDKTQALSGIYSRTNGKGNAGKVTVNTQGEVLLADRAGIFTNIDQTGDGNSQGVSIAAKNVTVKNLSTIQANNDGGKGTAGNIDITATGDIKIIDTSNISSNTNGYGDTGKINIYTLGKLFLTNQAGISIVSGPNAQGNSVGLDIRAENDVVLTNNSNIDTSTFGKGHAGNIKIQTNGKYEADNYSTIFATTSGDGAAGNINLKAKSINLNGGAEIQTSSKATGKAGDLTVTTPGDGFISISGNAPNGKLSDGRPGSFASGLLATAEKDSSSLAGKISLTTGTLSIENGGAISTRSRTNTAPIQPNNPKSLIVDGKYPEDPGAGSISIDAKNINITGGGQISTTSTGNAPAGDIILKNASAKLFISGSDPNYEQRKADLITAFPNGYIIENIVDIVSGKIVISSSNNSKYEQQKASLLAEFPNSYKVESITVANSTEVVEFTTVPVSQFSGIFATNREGSSSKGGSIILNPASLKVADSGQISVSNQGTGEGGNIFLFSNIATLDNGKIFAESKNAKGGDIKILIPTNYALQQNFLLLGNGSSISTNSGSSTSNGNGGNITIGSPFIIALPGNNDITANATAGNGGKLEITSQGLFGIKDRLKSKESNFTNDITANSISGQNGTVSITTPGTDPGKDSNQLPNVPNDASNQISQVCSANTRDNKLTVTGRGGLPPNANDTLNVDVVWQDARAAQRQPTPSSATTTNPFKLAPPAVGWVFDGKGKVTLIAASTQGQPTGTSVACPNQK